MLVDWGEVRQALLITWVILSAVLMMAVLAPFVLPEQKVFSLFPACEARLRGGRCVLCGMTTAYVLLASGDFGGALAANRYSVGLWIATIANFALAKAYILFRLLGCFRVLRQTQHTGEIRS